jgi:sugar (pentulose or hexulose) kinase
MDIFKEYNRLMGFKVQEFQLFKKILTNTSKADLDGGSIFSCNYYSGEPITNFYEGRPMLVYHSNSKFNLPNLFKTFLYSSFATLTIGFELLKKEKIKISSIVAHGGIFKTKYIAQTVLSAALNTKIIVNENASEGGPYGMALLTKYIFHNKTKLPTFLSNDVFKHSKLIETMATTNEILGFKKYMKLFKNGLLLEQKAIELFKL